MVQWVAFTCLGIVNHGLNMMIAIDRRAEPKGVAERVQDEQRG